MLSISEELLCPIFTVSSRKDLYVMKSMITVVKEQIQNFYLIRRLSIFEVRSENSNNYLGILWELIKPMLLISIYAFVFGVGIRGGRDTGSDIPFLPWLLAGIVIWFFFNPGLTNGTKSIYKRAEMISKMNFPMSVIPTYVILSKLYAHLFLVVVVFLILQFWVSPTVYLIQLPYYTFATVVLLISICLLTSTLATVARDVQMFITSTTRMLLYLSPILWAPESSKNLPDIVVTIMKLNPLYYVVEGYRHALLGESWYFLENPQYTLYFWFVVLFFLTVGSMLHMKFRDRFVEFI